MDVFLKLAWFFRQQWRRYGIVFAGLTGIGLIALLPPWIVGRLVDAFSDGSLTKDFLLLHVGWICVVAITIYFLRIIWRIALFGASHTLACRLRERIFGQLLYQPPAFYRKMKTGDLMARATNDIEAVEMVAGKGVQALFDGVFPGLAILTVMMVFISWPLTLAAFIPWPITGYFLWRFGTELHGAFTDAQARFGDLNENARESISSLRLTRIFGRERVEMEQFHRVATGATKANLRVAEVESKYEPAIQLAVGASFFLSVAGGAWLIWREEMTLGQLTSFTLYLGHMIWPMFALGWSLNLVGRGQVAYGRIEELLTMEAPIEDKGRFTGNANPTIDFDINAFRYPETQVAVLRDVHLRLEAGRTLGIVGPTGAGKSTLLHLLVRLEEQSSAKIRIGNRPIAEFTLENLRTHIAIVPQTPFLFSVGIAENIALGRTGATAQEIETAARFAQIHEDIIALPDGYETQVGERGVTLSGGQKQRIAIARALLQKAPILVLDDALSAVDARTEQSILSHLHEARRQRTTLIVCHRLSTVQTADHIIVLDRGALVEQGTHESLLADDGWYRRTFDYQRVEQAVEEGR
ncbi:MAG: ATP-binding cassette, subfamily B/ATP-binding cassette, subfamily B, multidrug efflux pump [Candidatus Kentron sp. G]|nr:MAG: ATP-binding cassette, subfamily B/ATP-binding cassette, subfamily B, multidrug efflux pump [Candidatus Kentron sp. G]VFN03137.1 MAG: ATP-binding cassette, subfamily B/ATP-binding cassette, subfamily B, multidrug efflux pump [Candidatus Kentron sp. G]VFN04665.1 MAG: ATP-binding cassette, subfamily B/ATP-binding cassette, subfamily B, multidrug efflux pump [Candidatus Kentron sp. G]